MRLRKWEKELKVIENAVGIVSLLVAEDEWARGQGERLAKGFTVNQMLAAIASTAVQLYAESQSEAEKAEA